MKHISSLFFILLFIISCSPKEQVVDNTNIQIKFILTTINPTPKLALVEFPSGNILSYDLLKDSANITITDTATKVAAFRDSIYVLYEKLNKIIVLNAKTYKKAIEYNFPANEGPYDICFASNGTAAYVAHRSDSSITIIDIYFNKIARNIKLYKAPYGIASCGNQVVTANQNDNSISFIDMRSDDITTIPVGIKPSFVDSFDTLNVVVACRGNGKIDPSEAKTAAMVYLLDINTKSIINFLELGSSSAKAIDQNPISVTVTNKFTAFIPTASYVFKYSFKNTKAISTVNQSKILYEKYSPNLNQLVNLKSSNNSTILGLADPNLGANAQTHTFQFQILSAVPIGY